MNNISKIDEKMMEFAEKVPEKGMHVNYFEKAGEIMLLYGDALSIMEDEKTPENEAKIAAIAKEIEEIVG